MEYIPNKCQSLKSLGCRGDPHLSKISESSHFAQCKHYYIINTFPHPFQTLMIILERRGRRMRRGRGRRRRRPEILLIDPKGQMLPIIRTLYWRFQSSRIFFSNVLLGFLSVIPTIRKGMQLGPVWNCPSDFFSWQISSQGS